ncbi:PTS transporter subunit EIIC [Pseudocitrobacter faecalis]|uniref:PTS transporter subunit EIIC n=1 Tax=Pseudocitrobacter faecalis TaxID=1398493 RepID=UPI003B9F166B
MREDYSGHLADLVAAVGGKENIIYITDCATRLRLSLQDNHKVNLEEIGNLERVKGVFNVGDQLQIIYGAGRVNEVCQALKETLSLDEANLQSSQQRQKPLQRFVKSISDVFLEIMPSILAAALLMGLTSLLTTKGLFGDRSIVEMYPQISGLNRLIAIASSGIFALLPMVVAWSATRRYGGRPALGLAIGAIMVHPGLVDAFSAASGNAAAETISIFGLPVELVGFQGGIIIALMIGYTVAWLDQYFNRKLPDIIKFVLSPMLTILLSSLLLFTIIGPFGRLLGSGITGGLLWMAEYLGIFGYMIFGAVQQLIVITGLHHTFGAIEGQLLASTGRDFLNPLMSVALMGQGGAVVGYMLLHFNDKKVQTLCVSAFTSILFGISEPALFGVNLKYRFPLMAGCVAGAAGAAWVYLSKLTAVGYGTTALPGITIVDPANHGHVNYVVAHLLALTTGAILTYIVGKFATRAEC